MNPMAYSVNDTCRLLGIGRSTFYRLAKDGTIRTRKLGVRTVVLAMALEMMLDSLPPGPGPT